MQAHERPDRRHWTVHLHLDNPVTCVIPVGLVVLIIEFQESIIADVQSDAVVTGYQSRSSRRCRRRRYCPAAVVVSSRLLVGGCKWISAYKRSQLPCVNPVVVVTVAVAFPCISTRTPVASARLAPKENR